MEILITIDSIHIGGPQSITDESGTWRSSIFRQPVTGPVELGPRGLAGDQVTDTENHGSPDQAVCCHPLDHYDYWNDFYDLKGTDRAVGAGSVGENWTLFAADEAEICVGDVYRVGSTRVQVSGPRMPCSKQERKLQLPDFGKRTRETLRTGFYLRVLTPGAVQVGDAWRLEDRPREGMTLRVINFCAYHQFDPILAHRLVDAPELAASWRRLFRRKLAGAA
jgi:MOSC domain-containing protein YiiM